MKQALIVVAEIKQLKAAVRKSKSMKLKNDYHKAIRNKKADLKEYCQYKGLNYEELIGGK